MNIPKIPIHLTLKRIIFIVVGIAVIAVFARFMYEYSQRSRASYAWIVTPIFGNKDLNFGSEGIDYVDVLIETTVGEKMSYGKIIIEYPNKILLLKHADTTKCYDLATQGIASSSVEENENTITIIRDKFTPNADLPDGAVCFVRLHFDPIAYGEGEFKFTDIENWEIQGPLGQAGIDEDAFAKTKTITIPEGTPLVTPSPAQCISTGNFCETSGGEDVAGDCCSGFSCQPYFINDIRVGKTCQVVKTPISATPTPTIPIISPTGPLVTQIVPILINAKINYRIKLQGITKQPKTAQSIDFKITLLQSGKAIDSRNIAFTPQSDGTWVADAEYKNIPSANDYYVTVKGPKHLQKRVCANNPQETIDGTYRCTDGKITLKDGNNTLDFSKIFMLAGDIPLQNGVIDAVDIAYIRNNVGSQNTEVIARGDLNYDGIVDSQDYTIIIQALSFKYDEEE